MSVQAIGGELRRSRPRSGTRRSSSGSRSASARCRPPTSARCSRRRRSTRVLQIVVDVGTNAVGARTAARGELDDERRGQIMRMRMLLALARRPRRARARRRCTSAARSRRRCRSSPRSRCSAALNVWEPYGDGDARPWATYMFARSGILAAAALRVPRRSTRTSRSRSRACSSASRSSRSWSPSGARRCAGCGSRCGRAAGRGGRSCRSAARRSRRRRASRPARSSSAARGARPRPGPSPRACGCSAGSTRSTASSRRRCTRAWRAARPAARRTTGGSWRWRSASSRCSPTGATAVCALLGDPIARRVPRRVVRRGRSRRSS